MTATIPSTGFLAGYRGLTREAYTLDLHQFSGWCQARSLPLFLVRRADIETFALELEAKGRARAAGLGRPPRTGRAIDLAVGERIEGPLFLAADGRRLDRHGCTKPPTLTHAGTGLLTTPTDRKDESALRSPMWPTDSESAIG